ncbi:MAG: methyltransferase domain-containing protein [Salinibacter sp.]
MSNALDSSTSEVREAVKAKYAAIARGEEAGRCGPDAGSCCGGPADEAPVNMIGEAYDTVEGYVADADLELGCGVPTDHAGLEPGQTVVDLGSGAGLDDETADVVLSNCVLNLVPDTVQAFAEMQRVLRPGGHFCVSDIVTDGPLPEAVRRSAELVSFSGALR